MPLRFTYINPFIPWRMTTAERDAEVNWPDNAVIMNTSVERIQQFVGEAWVDIAEFTGTPSDEDYLVWNDADKRFDLKSAAEVLALLDHDHDGTPTQKLLAANSHESPAADTHHSAESTATTTAEGVVELATAAEITAATPSRAMTNDAFADSEYGERAVQIVVIDFTTDVATGDGKAYLHIDGRLAGMNLVDIHGECITAGTTGTMDIQLRNVTQAADILSTKLTFDSTETGTDTAAAPAVIDTNEDDMIENDLLAVDIDAVQTTKAKGLIITLGFRLP